jgi:pimeloyl-ACP methyl ester carboxylesterase
LNLSGEKINLFEQKDSQKLAMDVLALVDETLKPHILAPFQNQATTLAYARQVLDFWSYDTLAKAPQVQAPILMIAAEYDKVAAPAMSKAALNYFPRARHVEVSRATHYCLFDRPELIAGMMEDFWENSNAST